MGGATPASQVFKAFVDKCREIKRAVAPESTVAAPSKVSAPAPVKVCTTSAVAAAAASMPVEVSSHSAPLREAVGAKLVVTLHIRNLSERSCIVCASVGVVASHKMLS
uniref:Uncharacterized protein n=1 Tax=Calcidiscus leptoporus TaxID=127549 RepID=A0A7S0J7D9_9EUKA|mmetsp:Transcript_43231/g.101291  ORF Transcript_43231/g.101291 Transcript_43231/m.101291 type:complete len:108 (+) Transcript_43231:110-433(+)